MYNTVNKEVSVTPKQVACWTIGRLVISWTDQLVDAASTVVVCFCGHFENNNANKQACLKTKALVMFNIFRVTRL